MICNSIVIKLISILLLLQLSGCISIIKGSEQRVSFTSEPEGALFSYYGKQCKAPCELVLPRTTRHSMIHVERDGYPPYSTDIAPDVDRSLSFLPIQIIELILLPIGITDMILCLGSGYQYDFPKEFHATYQAQLLTPKVEIKW